MSKASNAAGLLALSALAAACTVQIAPPAVVLTPAVEEPRRAVFTRALLSRGATAADALTVHDLLNAHRREAGCPELVWDERAAAAAQAHSDDMLTRDFYGHRSPEGVGPGARLDALGIHWRHVAENIALASVGPEEIARIWLESPTHRANIEDCILTHAGVGASGDRWTHVFFTL